MTFDEAFVCSLLLVMFVAMADVYGLTIAVYYFGVVLLCGVGLIALSAVVAKLLMRIFND